MVTNSGEEKRMKKEMMKIGMLGLFLFFASGPVAAGQETGSIGSIVSEVAGEVLMNTIGFSEEEKDLIRRYYRGGRASHGDYQGGSYEGRYRRDDDNGRYREHDRDRYRRYDDDGNDSGKKKGKKHKKKKSKKTLPPGLAGKDKLPPGLQKQLERNGTLPPGLAKRALPDDLKRMLPRRHPSHERTIVNDDVVLIEKATGRILDILYGGAQAR